ncbi:MAG: hypothetical protein MUF31_13115 [Akkermansiaceae bacterium]|jgi:hypothetical protein|nr:hypothetical protein [Akkermansiaceae bacterium]
MKKLFQLLGVCLLLIAPLHATEFRHIGDFVVNSRIKISEGRVVNVPIKPFRLSAFTDGISVRIAPAGESTDAAEYRIYRSDGIGRQRGTEGALEVIPGVQAISDKGGVLRQLRLTEETLTLTVFPGISNQTIITHAVAAAPPKAVPAPPAVTRKDEP